MIAHIGGMPVEETLLPMASGVGTALLLARAWVASHTRRHDQRSRPFREHRPGTFRDEAIRLPGLGFAVLHDMPRLDDRGDHVDLGAGYGEPPA